MAAARRIRPVPPEEGQAGYTIIEVLVSLAIVGICLTVFMGLIGSSLRLTARVEDHLRRAEQIRNQSEHFFLGLEEGDYSLVDNAKVWTGKNNRGVPWVARQRQTLRKQPQADDKKYKKLKFYELEMDGFVLDSVRY